MSTLNGTAIAVCDEHGDSPASNLLQDFLDQSERRIWFLFEILLPEQPASWPPQ